MCYCVLTVSFRPINTRIIQCRLLKLEPNCPKIDQHHSQLPYVIIIGVRWRRTPQAKHMISRTFPDAELFRNTVKVYVPPLHGMASNIYVFY